MRAYVAYEESLIERMRDRTRDGLDPLTGLPVPADSVLASSADAIAETAYFSVRSYRDANGVSYDADALWVYVLKRLRDSGLLPDADCSRLDAHIPAFARP